jgi:2-iminoacetate synthase
MLNHRPLSPQSPVVPEADVVATVLRDRPGPAAMAALLEIADRLSPDAYRSVIRSSIEAKRALFHDTVFPIAPLYVTSMCQEHCVYCNFRAGNRVDVTRRRLNDDELRKETEFLVYQRGCTRVELVYATDPLLRAPQIAKHIDVVTRVLSEAGGGSVGLNAEPFDVDDYRLFRDAGLDFIVLWQETYEQHTYGRIHPGTTKKANYSYRVDAYERMIRGGLTTIGLGVLSGLAPWQRDWLSLVEHGRYLEQNYGVRPSILGIPRLKPAAGALLKESDFIPTRQAFVLAIAAHNLVFPSCLPFVNTREDWDTCVEIAQGGGVLFTFDCATIPGGYTLGTTGYQFPTFSFDADVWVQRLTERGLHVPSIPGSVVVERPTGACT